MVAREILILLVQIRILYPPPFNWHVIYSEDTVVDFYKITDYNKTQLMIMLNTPKGDYHV